jgi:hypothetical protein
VSAAQSLVAQSRALSGHVVPAAPEEAACDPAALWAADQVTALNADDAPAYGSPAWSALPSHDPRRTVALIMAAEQWRRHTAREAWLVHLAEEDPDEWFRVVTADADAQARRIAPALARQPTHAELTARRAVRGQARAVVASPGWSPVAIPGRPDWWRHCGPRGEQLDLPHRHPPRRSHVDPRDTHAAG